ncbi:MAG TPA: aldehyde dehydrogenase family protein [Gemmatimonadales bacterium]|jgi:1-pyrroline-5-carboxylate dehydrogenase
MPMRPKKKTARPAKARSAARFRLTYATMFDPPEALHQSFERALAKVKAGLGRDHPMLIGGKERFVDAKFDDRSPIDRGWLLGTFQKGSAQDSKDAIAAARAAFPAWSSLPWKKRVAYLRKAASLIEQRVFEFAAIDALEVGKNRMEALADVQETADLINYYCDQVERHDGFQKALRNDPLKGYTATNRSVLLPYGVWVVIAPFNFPVALSGGPSGGALVAGNTVVFKPATDTPWTGYMLARCFLDAGLPPGVFNFVTGPGSTVGQELQSNPGVDGITFTGSYDVGMAIYRNFAAGASPRPCIAEMGGKNPVIVSRKADLDRAALGIFRSAFGLQGQKCSAASRIFVEQPVKAELEKKLVALLERAVVGDPTLRETYLGPVINDKAAKDYQGFVDELKAEGRILHGAERLTSGDMAKGSFCAPTLATDVPYTNRLWKHEMFLPIAMIGGVDSLDEAMTLANDVEYGLTAGFYGSKKEAEWFFDHIEAGVCYANRPQGATTGAWPGFQPFGGWKGSGSTGKSAGSVYYVQQFMREQSRTIVA